MVFFITFIRAISAMIITNAHYTGVYPTDLIANGGLLGDVLFFAVSGYCLANIKLSFGRWYGKRLFRIYLPVLLITIIYASLGFYNFSGVWGFIQLFIYPTYYHFVASILVLYIPFYCIMKFDFLQKRIPLILAMTLLAQILVYVFAFDKSTYHIDNVYSPMIWFLFFAAMLIGAYVRVNDIKFRNKNKIINILATVFLCVVYFASKMVFVKYSALPLVGAFQIANQYILLALLYFMFVSLAGLDNKLEKMPKVIKLALTFIANMTLEIYLVQYVLIPKLNLFSFPINWFVITAGIIVSAFVLHFVSEKIVNLTDKLISRKNNSQ